MLTDPIADFLTRIRNAAAASHDSVTVAYSGVRKAIADILKKERYISDYTVNKNESGRKSLIITLSYGARLGQPQSTMRAINRVSKPGRRVYVNHRNIPRPLRGMGTIIISTSRGITTGKEAVKNGLGGEVICEIW